MAALPSMDRRWAPVRAVRGEGRRRKTKPSRSTAANMQLHAPLWIVFFFFFGGRGFIFVLILASLFFLCLVHSLSLSLFRSRRIGGGQGELGFQAEALFFFAIKYRSIETVRNSCGFFFSFLVVQSV